MVGLEGAFGFSILSVVVFIMYYIPQPHIFHQPGTPDTHFEDAIDAFTQLANSWKLVLFTVGNVLSIAFFNYAGVSVTKHLNAATRMVLDSVRTVVIWGFSLAISWQPFCWMQCVGFVVLLSGTVVYNDVHPRLRITYFDYSTVDQQDADGESSSSTSCLLHLHYLIASGLHLRLTAAEKERLIEAGLDDRDGYSRPINHSGSGSEFDEERPYGSSLDTPLIASQDMLMTPTLGRATTMKQR